MAKLNQFLDKPQHSAEYKKILERIHLMQWELSDDPWFFLTQMGRTKDEHAAKAGLSPYRPFPYKEYIRHTVETVMDPRFQPVHLIIHKSRQIMISWFIVGMFDWACLKSEAQLCGIQTQKSDDANDLIIRGYGIWDRLPPVIKEVAPCTRKENHLSFPATNSDFRGFPRGADQVRRLTFSKIAVDEAAYVDELAATMTAIMPTLDEHAWFILISSAKQSFFNELVQDRI